MIACRPRPGRVGQMKAWSEKLSSAAKLACPGTIAQEPQRSSCSRAGYSPLAGVSTGSRRNGGASGPASGLSTRTISAR
jgi:hypothetical protein